MTKNSPRLRLLDPAPAPLTTTESLLLLAERLWALDTFIAAYGLGYWDHHCPDQLVLGERAA
jgi:hypothetical protein